MSLLNIDDIYFIFSYSSPDSTSNYISYHKIIEIIDETTCKLIVYKSIYLQRDENEKYYNHKQYDVPFYNSNVVKGKICNEGGHDLKIQYRPDKRQWVSGYSINNIYGSNEGGFIGDEEKAIIEFYTDIVRNYR